MKNCLVQVGNFSLKHLHWVITIFHIMMNFDKLPIFKNASQSWFIWLVFHKSLGNISLAFYVIALPLMWMNITEWLVFIYGDSVPISTTVINIFITLEASRATVCFI